MPLSEPELHRSWPFVPDVISLPMDRADGPGAGRSPEGLALEPAWRRSDALTPSAADVARAQGPGAAGRASGSAGAT